VSAPIGPSATETNEQRVAGLRERITGSSTTRPSLDPGVWVAAAALSPVALMGNERRFKFRGLPQAVGAARRVLHQWEEHFEPDLFYDLSLCVSELVTNTVQRSDPAGEEIELVVRRGGELIRAEVREHRPDVVVTSSPAEENLEVWGMFIVDRVADRWGVERDRGTVVWCEIDLAGDRWSRKSSPPGMKPSSALG
jgi:anti-sigma regulatory factor (Ser/Thr protein kinase)